MSAEYPAGIGKGYDDHAEVVFGLVGPLVDGTDDVELKVVEKPAE